jgi:hypothetical protein
LRDKTIGHNEPERRNHAMQAGNASLGSPVGAQKDSSFPGREPSKEHSSKPH